MDAVAVVAGINAADAADCVLSAVGQRVVLFGVLRQCPDAVVPVFLHAAHGIAPPAVFDLVRAVVAAPGDTVGAAVCVEAGDVNCYGDEVVKYQDYINHPHSKENQ